MRYLDPDFDEDEGSELSESAVSETPRSDQSKEYDVFYELSDIKATYTHQKTDMFEELGETRKKIIMQNNGMRGLQLQNKINILKHAPNHDTKFTTEEIFLQ